MNSQLTVLLKKIWHDLHALLREKEEEVKPVAEAPNGPREWPPSPLGVKVQSFEKAVEEYKASQNQSYRLQWWTFWLAVITLALLVGNVVFAWIQLRKFNETTRRQFSPHLLYENSRIDVAEDGRSYTAFIQVKNFGETPAYSVRHWFTVESMARLSDPYQHFRPYTRNPVRFRGPEDGGFADIGKGDSICVRATFPTNNATGRGDVFYLWGDVKYWDEFKRCDFDAFVLQSVDPITNGAKIRLANVFNWASDTTGERNRCNERHVAWIPWPEDEIKRPDTEPIFSVFQGVCPD